MWHSCVWLCIITKFHTHNGDETLRRASNFSGWRQNKPATNLCASKYVWFQHGSKTLVSQLMKTARMLLAECTVERAKLPRTTAHHNVKLLGKVQVGLQFQEFLMSELGSREWSASRSERVARLTLYLPAFTSCTAKFNTYHHPVPVSWNLGTLTSSNSLGHSGSVTGLLYLTAKFNTYKFHILPTQTVFMCFMWIWEQTAIISLYNTIWLVFRPF